MSINFPNLTHIDSALLFWILFWILFLVAIFLKGWALWKAGNLKHKAWFIVLFLLNTMGILDILYIFIFSKKIQNKQNKQIENQGMNQNLVDEKLEKEKPDN
ncbi:MAG: DUF5652 family protein [Minisyncoccia bacterium]